jgi:hypothetical protein
MLAAASLERTSSNLDSNCSLVKGRELNDRPELVEVPASKKRAFEESFQQNQNWK